jgi:type VI secretion system protein ImpD
MADLAAEPGAGHPAAGEPGAGQPGAGGPESGAPAAGRDAALRDRLIAVVSGASRGGDTAPLDTWLGAGGLGERLRAWFGAGMVADRRWLLLALDRDVAEIDALLSAQVNAILHAPVLQRMEARWRGLLQLTEAAELAPLARVRVLPASWSDVTRDLDRAFDFDRSQLFAKIYTQEIGMLGGEPFGLLIGDYEIQHRPSEDHPSDDVAALKSLAMIAAAAFAPMVMGASPRLFQLDGFSALGRPFDLRAVFDQIEYQRWQSMRQGEETRFIGLALPRVLMRRPYAIDAARRDGFRFEETVHSARGEDHLWGNAAIAFGAVVLRAFANYGWFADIRGAARDELRGGLVTDSPVVSFSTDARGVAVKPSLEALISDAQEKDLSDLGFIALRKVPFSEYSVFYANQSIHLPPRYDRPLANINARLSAMLQYMLCVSRFAHYVKLIGRSFIGTMQDAAEVQSALQSWLMNYCVGSDDAPLDTKARHPLREASVEIKEVPGRAGAYSCVLFLRPHFQLDDIATGFRLVTQLTPAAEAA